MLQEGCSLCPEEVQVREGTSGGREGGHVGQDEAWQGGV